MYKYQVIFFGNNKSAFSEIKRHVLIEAQELGIAESLFVFYENEEAKSYCGNQPSFCMFSNTERLIDDNIKPLILQQIEEGNTILPLYKEDFAKEIPDFLNIFNGEKYSSNTEAISNYVLEGFNLLRRKRKLFISYRRSDAREIAIQLYGYFESLNYNVFLDTHSVPKGTIFQEYLWHEISDSDIVLLLDTHDFLQSEWCDKELSFASAKHIAILRTKFPSSSVSDDSASLMVTHTLSQNSFEGNYLNSNELKAISLEIESLRARALAARQDNIIAELIKTGELHSKNVKRINFNLLNYSNNDKGEILFIPAIGVPQSTDFHEVELKYHERVKNAKAVYLIYDDTSILKSWQNHLKWLDSQLNVKSLSRSDFSLFFSEN